MLLFSQKPTPIPNDVLTAIEDLKKSIDSRVLVEQIKGIVWGPCTLTTKVAKIKLLLPL